MNILTNTSLFRNGGIERNVNEFEKYLKNSGEHRLITFLMDSNKSPGKIKNGRFTRYNLGALEGFSENDLLYSGVDSIDGFKKRVSPLIAGIEKIIKEEKIDLSVSQGTYFLPWCGLQAALETRVPIIEKYAGVLFLEENYKSGATSEILGLFKSLESSFNHSDVFTIFPSELTRKTVRELYGENKGGSVVIPNGIAEEFFRERNNGDINEHIGYIARYDAIKNPEFMDRLALYLSKKGMDLGVHLVTENKNTNRTYSDNVTIHNIMDTRKLREFYQAMGVILCPSYFETFGNVPAEAVASGTPALISNRMGVGEVFKKIGLDKFIIDFKKSLGEIVDSVNEFVYHPPKLDEARQKLRDECSWNIIYKRIISECERVVA